LFIDGAVSLFSKAFPLFFDQIISNRIQLAVWILGLNLKPDAVLADHIIFK